MPSTMTPWEVTRFKNFLADKKGYIINQVSSELTKQVVDLVFQILQKELNFEYETESQEMYANHLKERSER